MEIGTEQILSRPQAVPEQGLLHSGRTWILAAGDLAALVVAYVVTYIASDWLGALPPVSAPGWFLVSLGVVAGPIWLAVFTAYHLYENDNLKISIASFDEVRDLFHAMLAGSLGFLILSQGVDFFFDWWVYTAVEALFFITAALILVPIVRGSIRSWVFPRVMSPRRTLVVGGGHDARLVYRKLQAHPEYGLEVVGFLAGGRESEDVPGPILGAADDIAQVVDEFEIDRVLLASSIASHEEMLDLVRTVRRPDVHVSIVPRYFEIFTSHATLDVVGAAVGLVLLSPLFLTVALAIVATDGRPVLFRQERAGLHGRRFRVVKFRTMARDADGRRAELRAAHNEVQGAAFKMTDDPRVTPLGRSLRRTSLDELPQLWNVLRGDMSLVGPRPHPFDDIAGYDIWHRRRLSMKPGITGLWQVGARRDPDFDRWVQMDLEYIDRWSLVLDLRVMLQTIPALLRATGR